MNATASPTSPPCVPPVISRAAEAAQFQQFTRWMFWLCLIFGGVMLAAGLHLDDPRLELMAAILVGHATITCTLVARARVKSLERAGLIMSMATLLSILAFSFVAPAFGPALVVATLVPATLALQHGRRQSAQRWLIALCWLGAVFIGVLGELPGAALAQPTWFDRAFRLSGIGCISGIMLMLLWHAARRTWDHSDAADQHQQDALIAEARLADARTQLEHAIEERTRLVSQLRDAQQLAVLGRLVGGVAQDFNNHLTSLVGYTELLLWELTEENGKRADLLEIRRAAERATLLTQQLLAFSHVAPTRPVIVNLADVIMSSVRVLRRVLGPDVRLVTTLGRDAALVRADPASLGYVLLSLGAEAREAMPHGGTLTIETTHLDVDLSATTHSDLRDWSASSPAGDLLSGFVRVTMSTARRTDLPARPRLFPDTAGATAAGSPPRAFGVAAIEDIVRESGGSVIATADTFGDMTTIIYLPRAMDVESPVLVETVAPRGTETVLVVESENVVRDYVRTLLERHGYHTLVADSPGTALSLAQTAKPPVDLAIVNLVLPDESADRLASALVAARPGISLLYMTHHLASARADLQRMPRAGFVIEKPFKPNEFLLAVRQALDSVPAARTFHQQHH
jgi:signal transduction histidine kinase/CheY-like chemotaxis protein